MKAKLIFDLPEEQSDFELATNAAKYYSVLWNIDQFLRNKVKYASDSASEEEIKAYEETREELWREIESNNINLEG
jgi:hypothetical protein